MGPVSEEHYALARRRRELATLQCARTGHEWNVLSSGDRTPVRIVCESCGWGGTVTMGERR
jgi:hypothetical protein